MLKLNLFGTAQGHYLEQPLVGFPNHQAYSLLCYLLLNRPVSYTHLTLPTSDLV